MRILIAIVLLARTASAGPYCGADATFTPPAGPLPVHPWLVFAQDNNKTTARNEEAEAYRTGRTFVATLDGKPVALRVTSATSGKWLLRTVEVRSTLPGKLVVEVRGANGVIADQHTTEYRLDKTWVAPSKLAATLGRYHYSYHPNEMHPETVSRDGVALAVDAPATTFRVSWRRDASDSWRVFDAPATTLRQANTLQLGEVECTTDNIPLGLLRQGVHVVVKARLPDNRWVPVGGIPDPLVLSDKLPIANAADPEPGAPPEVQQP